MSAAAATITVIIAAPYHFGMCFYIAEMVTGLSDQMAGIAGYSQSELSKLPQNSRFTAKIIEEIHFHGEIIEYVYDSG